MIQTQVYGGGYGRSGGTSTEDTMQGGHTIVTDGTISIRIENTGGGSRSFWVESDPRYADLDMTSDAPFGYRRAIAYWTEWLEGHSTPAAIAA